MEDWIKEGATVYVKNLNSWMKSEEIKITKVGRKYFYLEGYPKIKIDISTLYGSYPDYDNICKVYHTKAHYDREEELLRKRKVLVQSVHLLTDEEVIEIYNEIIQRDRKQ